MARSRCSNARRAALAGCAAALVAMVLAPQDARADDWQPRGIVPASAALAGVVAAARVNDAIEAQRRERWTYVNGTKRIAVNVAVHDDDFRTSLDLDGLTYTSGRHNGIRWRGDGNGVAHSVMGDMQSDAADVAPQALFRIDWAACTLAGEIRVPKPMWVLETHRTSEKPAFLYIDEASGAIVREVLRDGQRIITTTFDRFEAVGSHTRARHWHVDDGKPAFAIDATRNDVSATPTTDADVAPPGHIEPGSRAPATTVDLPATFENYATVLVAVNVNGGRVRHFFLDTGTDSITLDPGIAPPQTSSLEHATVARLDVGALHFDNVSTLTVPFWQDGLLGLDFFFGHVVEIGYRSQRVRVLSNADASAVFTDPKTSIVPIDIDLGLPVVHAAIGPAASDSFALDTGSPKLRVMAGFAKRNAAALAALWTPIGPPYETGYLEGPIHVKPYRVDSFQFAGSRYRNISVGVQIPSPDDLVIPFDAIIGTEVLANYDLYFDYDNNRLGLRD